MWARGEAHLNNHDQFFGNLPNPILRANEHFYNPIERSIGFVLGLAK